MCWVIFCVFGWYSGLGVFWLWMFWVVLVYFGVYLVIWFGLE